MLRPRTHNRGQDDPNNAALSDISTPIVNKLLKFLDFVCNLYPKMMADCFFGQTPFFRIKFNFFINTPKMNNRGHFDLAQMDIENTLYSTIVCCHKL